MFLRQLSSFGSSFLPRSLPPLCRAGFRSSSASSSYLPWFSPAPHPWSSLWGFPPWPPRLPASHPAAHQVFSGRPLHPRIINPGNFGGSWHPFSTSAGLMMERPDRDREPPHKRRKSAEERRSAEEREHRGGAAGHHPNHHFRDGSRDKGKNGAGKGVRGENSRDKDVERTKSKDRQRKDSARDGTPNRGKSEHQQGGHKDSQPASSRTQTPKTKPVQDKVHMHRPNPWFKDRAAEEQGQGRDRGQGGGQWTGLHSQPCSTPHPPNPSKPPNPWQVAGATRQPPPPGTCPPVGQEEDVKPVKGEFTL